MATLALQVMRIGNGDRCTKTSAANRFSCSHRTGSPRSIPPELLRREPVRASSSATGPSHSGAAAIISAEVVAHSCSRSLRWARFDRTRGVDAGLWWKQKRLIRGSWLVLDLAIVSNSHDGYVGAYGTRGIAVPISFSAVANLVESPRRAEAWPGAPEGTVLIPRGFGGRDGVVQRPP